jgi:hypothetical protein
MVFGGPLLGDPDRRHRTTASLARACRRVGSASPRRPSIRFGHTSTLRASRYAHKCAHALQPAYGGAHRRLPRRGFSARQRRSPRAVSDPSASLRSETHTGNGITRTRDVSTTSWDDLGRLKASHSSPRLSCSRFVLCSIQAKQTSRARTFQRRFGTFRNVPNVPAVEIRGLPSAPPVTSGQQEVRGDN